MEWLLQRDETDVNQGDINTRYHKKINALNAFFQLILCNRFNPLIYASSEGDERAVELLLQRQDIEVC